MRVDVKKCNLGLQSNSRYDRTAGDGIGHLAATQKAEFQRAHETNQCAFRTSAVACDLFKT